MKRTIPFPVEVPGRLLTLSLLTLFTLLGCPGLGWGADYLTRSRPEPELRQQVHEALKKSLPEEYVDVSVIQHSILSSSKPDAESGLIPGLRLSGDKVEANILLRYRTVILSVTREVDLDQVEVLLRREIKGFEPQDRFDQSVVLENRANPPERLSADLVDYLALLEEVKAALREGDSVTARSRVEALMQLSAQLPLSYQALGVQQLMEQRAEQESQLFTFGEQILLGALGLLLLLILSLFFFIARSTRKEEQEEHPLTGTLERISAALESAQAEATTVDVDVEQMQAEVDLGGGDRNADEENPLAFLNRLPVASQLKLLLDQPPPSRAAVLTQLSLEEGSEILQQMPAEAALPTLVALRTAQPTPNELQQLGAQLEQASRDLPMDYQGLEAIAQYSGQFDQPSWTQILEASSTESLAADQALVLEEIRQRSMTFEQLHEWPGLEQSAVTRIMESFEGSRLSNGSRVSLPYLLLGCPLRIKEMVLAEFTADTVKYYEEQLQALQTQRSEESQTEGEESAIQTTMLLHQRLFMKLFHQHFQV